MSSYGYCPQCGAVGLGRERRPDGNDRCTNGHFYPSKTALSERPKGPLAFAVSSQHEADTLREMLGATKGPNDQGIMVIPFGGSVLSFSPGGTTLLRGYVSIPPNGGPITRQAFEAWIEKAISPYLAPNASRLVL